VTPGGASIRADLQRLMTRDAGVVRSGASLAHATDMLASLVPPTVEEANLLAVSTALVRAASARCESRGTHTRSDHPETSPEYLGRFVFSGGEEPEFVPLFAPAATR
jgi:L-aspartate oxidase